MKLADIGWIQALRRVTAILLQQKNFGPNVIYVAGILILYYIKYRYTIILFIMYYKRRHRRIQEGPIFKSTSNLLLIADSQCT